MQRRKFLHLALLGGVLVVSGCAGRGVDLAPARLADAIRLWRSFVDAQALVGEPVRVSGTAYVTREERTNRVTFALWGAGGVWRMDVQAGMGSMLAMVREEAGQTLLVYPQDGEAYTATRPGLVMRMLGVRASVGLREVAHMALGRLGALMPPAFGDVQAAGDHLRYTLPASRRYDHVTLDSTARAVALTGADAQWRVRMDKYTASGPETISATSGATSHTREVELLVKSVALGGPPVDTGLELPPGVFARPA